MTSLLIQKINRKSMIQATEIDEIDMEEKWSEYKKNNAKRWLEYFLFCLRIQEQMENSKRFNSQQSSSMEASTLLCHVWKQRIVGSHQRQHGDPHDNNTVEGWTDNDFSHYLQLRDFWLKYFQPDNNQDMTFHNLIRT